MATWDGSCSGPDDQNYYAYTDNNVPETVTGSWTFYPSNMNNDYIQTNREIYVQNGPMLDQHSSNVFYHSNTNGEPSLLSTGNHFHSTNPVGNAQGLNKHEYLPNSVKPQRCYVPDNYQNHSNNFKQNRTKHNSSTRGMAEMTNSIKQSQLHATAEEFQPDNTRATRMKHEREQIESVPAMNDAETTHSRPSDKYFYVNSNKYDRRFNGKRSSNYRLREDPRDEFYSRNVRFNQQQDKSRMKYQGNKYFTNKYYPDRSRKDTINVKENALDKYVRNTVACDSKVDSVTQSNEGEFIADANLGESKSLSARENDNAMIAADNDKVQDISDQQPIRQIREHGYNNSGLRQSSSSYRIGKKYQQNIRYTRQENGYRERQLYYQGYSRENSNKEIQFKDQASNNSDCTDTRECPSQEFDPDARDQKEKKFKYKGYNGFRDQKRESKMETYGAGDKSKNYTFASKGKTYEHWRNKRGSNENDSSQRLDHNKKSAVDDDANQRERLADQLNRGQLECLVCCECIKQNDYIWSCCNCYHVLHLKCVKKWAKSSQAENGWRCPACQNVSLTVPEDYFCFCGKTRAPEWNRRDIAHSCGETCGRTLSKNTCPHKCTLLCHPGSCPVCTAMVTKFCGCGKTSQTVQCSAHKLLLCDSICGKDLNCGKHKCEKTCHHGECSSCEKKVVQECYCGKDTREVICEADVSTTYSCDAVCGKLLKCENHTCAKLCHDGDCEPCALTPDKITTCCCGQTQLAEERQTCLDPVPTCDKICSKNLKCGQPNNPHKCKAKCHPGDCPVCDLTTDVKCRCGNMDREIACKDLVSKADDARCEKRCTKRRSCGKHKCNQLCCIEIEHICPLTCSKTLSCGRHKCEQSCHKGRCQPCWRSSFDELYCECGASVVYPPVPCGTRRPTCDRPCTRQHSCGHEVLHNCHSEPTCPPCTVLTQRWCYGKHELRKAVPCHVSEISCGLPCSKPLSCGRHKCITTCHAGPCEKPDQRCTQPCTALRELCGHICAAPCHEDKCPDIPCKEMVKVSCQCGHRTTTRMCAENSKEYQRIASSILASKMADMQLGHSINLDQVFGQGAKRQNQLKTLECNDECKLIERNRRLALALQIANPDLSGKLMPRYSDFMKQWAKKDPAFCQMVHEKLTELVQLAKISKQKSRSYSFDCMNKDKRHFVHESCEHFGCESQAYDQEPKRNVVATAVRDKCWLPSYSLLEIVQRENGQRKVPGPMLNTSKADGPVKKILSLPTKVCQKPEPQANTKLPEAEIDYFDYQG